MSTSISLSNGITLHQNTPNELLFKKGNTDIVTLTNGQISQSQTPLTPSQTLPFLHEIIKAEFSIPPQMKITKLKHTGKNAENFGLKIEAQSPNSSVNIDFATQNNTIRLEKKTSDSKALSKYQINTQTSTELSEFDGQNKSFSESSQNEINNAGDRYTTTRNQIIKSTLSKNGKSLTLEAINQETDSECPEFTNNKTTLDISAEQITKQITQNSDRLKRKLQITYDIKTHAIQCKLQETEFNAYTLIEHKNTLLTPILKKKAVIRTPFDRNLTAKLTIDAQNHSQYQAKQTMPDMTEKEISVENDLQQLPEIIKTELTQIKEIAAKTAILQNAQNHNPKTNFSNQTNLFEPYIGFTEIKDKPTYTLVTAFSSPEHNAPNLHRQLLTQLHFALSSPTFLLANNTKKSR
ncbi:MAG: hypothetical protein J6J35_03175 [Alphaproteobacteria bacterium]|nr:hypothetical protein [Alphaproteobacteria bacterium]